MEIFNPVASSILSVPGELFTSKNNGFWVSLFLDGMKSTPVKIPPIDLAAWIHWSSSNFVSLIVSTSAPWDAFYLKSPLTTFLFIVAITLPSRTITLTS